jgi:hypothetical protein
MSETIKTEYIRVFIAQPMYRVDEGEPWAADGEPMSYSETFDTLKAARRPRPAVLPVPGSNGRHGRSEEKEFVRIVKIETLYTLVEGWDGVPGRLRYAEADSC